MPATRSETAPEPSIVDKMFTSAPAFLVVLACTIDSVSPSSRLVAPAVLKEKDALPLPDRPEAETAWFEDESIFTLPVVVIELLLPTEAKVLV